MMVHGTVKRLPIVELEVEGKKRLYFADKHLDEYRAIDNTDTVHSDELDGTMEEIIKRFRVLGIHKTKKGGTEE